MLQGCLCQQFLLEKRIPWNSVLPKECFPLTYDLNGFNRPLLTVGSF